MNYGGSNAPGLANARMISRRRNNGDVAAAADVVVADFEIGGVLIAS